MEDKKLLKSINKKLDDINMMLMKGTLEFSGDIKGKKSDIFFRNFLAGIARGVGIAIGFTVIGAIIIYLLQKIIMLNIPIIGEYLKDIVNIVQENSFRP